MRAKAIKKALLFGPPVLLSGFFALAAHQAMQANEALTKDSSIIGAAAKEILPPGAKSCGALQAGAQRIERGTTTTSGAAALMTWTFMQFDEGCISRAIAVQQLASYRSLLLDRDRRESREQWAMRLPYKVGEVLQGRPPLTPYEEALRQGVFDLDRHLAKHSAIEATTP